MARACRVLPDVTAVDRAFDYSVPDALEPQVQRVVVYQQRVQCPPERLLVEPFGQLGQDGLVEVCRVRRVVAALEQFLEERGAKLLKRMDVRQIVLGELERLLRRREEPIAEPSRRQFAGAEQGRADAGHAASPFGREHGRPAR